VRGNVVSISVLSNDASTSIKAKQAAGSEFLRKWAGSAKPLLAQDLADDPRSEHLLGRYLCAEAAGADVVVTRNVKDFAQAAIPVKTPMGFLKDLN